MFCSNCGKSLKSEHTVCPYCGMTVGESRFDSNRGYTGAQPKLRPGQAVRVNNSYGNHYSTSFNVESDKAARDLPSDEDSSYRAAKGAGITGYSEEDDREPLFDSDDPWSLDKGGDETEEVREEAKPEKRSFRSMFLRKDEEEDQKAESEDDDDALELTEEEKNSIRLSEEKQPSGKGISDDVRRFMTGLREENERRAQEQERKAAKKKAKKQADEEKSESMSFDAYDDGDSKKKKKKAKKSAKFEEDFDLDEEPEDEEEFEDEPDEVEEEKPPKEKKPSRKQIRVAKEFFRRSKPEEEFDDYDPDELEDEELPPEDEEDADDYDDDDIDYELRRSNRLKILRMALAAASALLLIVLGILIFRNIKAGRENVAPVEDVTPELWTYGTELMQYRVSDDYIEQKMSLYNASNQNGSWAQFSAAFTADLDGLDALLPDSATRQMNDQLFVDALKAIQTNINNCLSNDWMAKMDTAKSDTAKGMESASRWQVVRNQVSSLINATSRGELDAVRKGEVVAYSVPTKEETKPEATTVTGVTYKRLAKGSSGDEVINLQTQLINLGYLNDVADGKYGNKTVTAVQLFQQTVGLEVTGVADEETQRRLFSDDVPVYQK